MLRHLISVRASSFEVRNSYVFSHDVFLLRALVGFFWAYQATVIQINQCIVHQTHALFFAGLNDAGQDEGFVFANHIPHSWRIRENFEREHAACSIYVWYQLVTDDAAQ